MWHNDVTGEIQIWFMQGFSRAGRMSVIGDTGGIAHIGPPFSIVGVADFDGNGCSDIVWYNSTTGETQIWFMDGGYVKRRATVINFAGKAALIGPPFSIVAIADFNNDGLADILWHNSNTGETQIWYMREEKLEGRASVVGTDGKAMLVGSPFSIVGAGSFSYRSNTDIVWHNSQTGETQIWFMDGATVSGRQTVIGEDGKAAFVGDPFRIVGIPKVVTRG